MDLPSFPSEYQTIVAWIREQHGIRVTPLQELRGGQTGARLYLVSARSPGPEAVAHYILKLDRVRERQRSDEIQRHRLVQEQAPAAFVRGHMPELIWAFEHASRLALFYTIAGHSLQNYRALAEYNQQTRLEVLFRCVHGVLMDTWNAVPAFKPALPQDLLKKWLGYRLTSEGNLVDFLEGHARVPADMGGFLVDGEILPNPIAFGVQGQRWGRTRPLDAVYGFQHGDLNIGNLLVNFPSMADQIQGLYLIDFALYKADMPLMYDLRYLEMSFLLRELERVPFEKWTGLVSHYASQDLPDPRQVPVELAGACAVINAGRLSFRDWVEQGHPSLTDDLWGQSCLASVAAGLNYCNKTALSPGQRLAGLVYAAAHLKLYCTRFGIPIPTDLGVLYDPHNPDQAARPRMRSTDRSRPSRRLPLQPTSFIGRQREIAGVKAMLLGPDVRLLTLTGPGGTGKTRLALQVAEEIQPHFEDGVTFVPLADIRNPDLLVTRIGQELGFREGGSLPLLEIIKSYLADRKLLLVLDNFEQILAAGPRLVELLGAAPGLRMLVTSRNLLSLSPEHEFAVAPLGLPHPEQVTPVETLPGFDAVRLFLVRARAAEPHFDLTGENAAAVLEICRRLDGLPLAIELAAARLRLLSPKAMLARLDDRLALLTGGARDLPDRHRTLRSTIDWSYELLGEPEKILFARLAVFVGGFTLEAVEAVCDPDGSLDVLSGIETLLVNSLIRADKRSDGQGRFAMLETIREYALERLRTSGELDRMRQAHAAYFSEIMRELGQEQVVFSAEIGRWLDWIDEEHENLRAVKEWSQSAPDRYMPGVMCVSGMFWYWYRRGHLAEGRDWIEWALSTPAGSQPSELQGLMVSANAALAMHQSDLEAAQSLSDRGLAIAASLEEARAIGILLTEKGMILTNRGRDAEARALLEQGRDLFIESRFDWWLTDNLLTLSTAVLGLGEVEEALAIVRQADQVSKGIGDDWLTAYVLNGYGEVARVQGDYDLAGEYYREGERLLRSQGDRGGELPRIVHSQGYVARRQGNLGSAGELFRESLSIFLKIGNRRGIAESLAGIASVWAGQGDSRQSAVLLGAASRIMESAGAEWWPADRLEYRRSLDAIRSALSEQEFRAAWQEGQAMTPEEAIEFAAPG